MILKWSEDALTHTFIPGVTFPNLESPLGDKCDTKIERGCFNAHLYYGFIPSVSFPGTSMILK